MVRKLTNEQQLFLALTSAYVQCSQCVIISHFPIIRNTSQSISIKDVSELEIAAAHWSIF